MSLRWSLRRVRRHLRPFRLVFAAGAGTLGTVLSTAYEEIPAGLRIASLCGVALLTAAAVLLTESIPAMPIESWPQVSHARTDDGGRTTPRPAGRANAPAGRRAGRRRYRRPRKGTAPAAPPGDGLFHGRERELADLIAWHDQQRFAGADRGFARGRTGRNRQATGPVLLLIHGKQGVGKSAIAEELARRLASQYPHGQVVANFGTAGGARTPAEVLRELLLILGWSEAMPTTAVGRAIILRSLTRKKKILFIFDAVRHADQVLQVLPSDPSVGVIVTSRRDLSSEPGLSTRSYRFDRRSYQIDIPSEDEALGIFRLVSDTHDSMRPECAAEIVHMCGRLPAALRSAGERVSHDGTDICHVAGLIRPLWSRLDWLERPGRQVRAHIQADFDRLLPGEQRALAMLALVPSPTFIPWVLSPLLGVPHAEAEALMDRLAAAQLLDNMGSDEPSGLARYGFQPLVRLFVSDQAKMLTQADREQAAAQLVDAYQELVGRVLAVVDETFKVPTTQGWVPDGSDLPHRIAARLDHWSRAEYPNLLQLMSVATRRRNYALCWRVGTWLAGCVPAELDLRKTLSAYSQAIRAARADNAPLGQVDALLAKGSFLTAIERYRDAEVCLSKAAAVARQIQQGNGAAVDLAAARREATARRKIGEAYMQAASFAHAATMLDRAFESAILAGDEDEQRLIRILIAETNHVDSPEATYDENLDGRLSDISRYRVFLALAEAARRRGDWEVAGTHFDEAMLSISGDLRRVATIHYRTARLSLDQYRAGTDGSAAPVGTGDQRPGVQALRRAAAAAVAFRRMGNAAGLVRAHCLLARALLTTGNPIEAEQVTHVAECELAALDGAVGPAHAPLMARVKRARGLLLTHAGRTHDARVLLMQAATVFGEHHDWTAQSKVLAELGTVPGTSIGDGATGPLRNGRPHGHQ